MLTIEPVESLQEEPPTLEECRHLLAEWSRHVQAELDEAEANIESLETQLKAADDKMVLRGTVEQLAAGGIAGAGGIVGIISPPVGAALGVGGVAFAALGQIRTLIWRPKKKHLERRIAEAKVQRRKWLEEKEAVEDARRSIEQQIADERRNLPHDERGSRMLPRPTAPKKSHRKRKKRRQ